MALRRVEPQDYGWETLFMLEERREKHMHSPHRMRSAQSHGPIYAYVCDSWRQMVTSTSSVPPVCFGGHDPFDFT